MPPILFPLLAVAGINLLAWLSLSRVRKGRWRVYALSLLLVFDSLFVTLALLEAGFFLFMDQSDGFNITMSSKKWFKDHWKPVNSLGYRDDEPAPPEKGRKAVLVVGDSFAAGHGVDDYRDRFSNRLGGLLGPGYRVYNASDIGWDTPEELQALRTYPVKPDIVVLSYYLNDIFGAANKVHFDAPFGVKYPSNSVTRYLVDNFALANFVYWRLARMGNMENAAESFWGRLKAAFSDPAVWGEHEKELGGIVQACREEGARLIVLIFPNFLDAAGSAPLTAKIAAYFQSRGATAFDLAPMFEGRDPDELVVNCVDAHPNASVHEEMAGLLKTAILN